MLPKTEELHAPEILLSLCMATMNRAALLGETLESILPQMQANVEIVILDGASKDDTAVLVAGYAARHPNVIYLRENAASGVDVDFDKAVMAARGRYCWLLGDDDLLKPGSIRRVLDACAQGHDLVVVDAEVRSADLSELLTPRRLTIAEDTVYSPPEINELFHETARHLTFIGAVIIRRALWIARDRQKYFGTEFVHVGVIFQAALPGTTLVVAEPMVAIRYGNAHWSERAFEIWMFKWPQLIWSFNLIQEHERLSISLCEPWRSLRNLLLYRAYGSYNAKVFSRLIWPRTKALEWLVPWVVSWVPAVPVNLAVIMFFRLLRPHFRGALQDLYSSPNWIGNLVRKH